MATDGAPLPSLVQETVTNGVYFGLFLDFLTGERERERGHHVISSTIISSRVDCETLKSQGQAAESSKTLTLTPNPNSQQQHHACIRMWVVSLRFVSCHLIKHGACLRYHVGLFPAESSHWDGFSDAVFFLVFIYLWKKKNWLFSRTSLMESVHVC